MSHRTGRRFARPAIALTALVTALLACACSSTGSPAASPSVQSLPPSGQGDYPVVLQRQVERVERAARAAIAAAISQGSVSAADSRVAGPAGEVLAARITVATAERIPVQWGSEVTPSRVLAPSAGPWPRWFVIAGPASGLTAPVVQLYRSASAREPYALWGRLTVLPGATLPEVAQTVAGASALDPATDDLVASPSEVAAHYADLLNRGTASAYATAFAADDFRAQVDRRLVADRASVVQSGLGTLTDSHDVDPGAVYALRAVDGGALVIAALRQTYAVQVTPGKGAVTVDADLAALAGRAQFAGSLRRVAVEVLAFRVPPNGSADRVRLVAASKDDVAASGS